MAIITPNASILVGRQRFGVMRYDAHDMSGENGASSDALKGVPRWLMSMQSPDRIDAAAMDEWRSVLVRLRGRVNFLAMWDTGRPAPRGTMRGTLTLVGAHAQGATVLNISGGVGQAGKTLVPGDWLQLGSGLTGQLVMVVIGGTADGTGAINVTVENPIRLLGGYANGTAVTWDRALGHYKMTSEAAQWVMEGGLLQSGAAADFMEQW